MSKKSSKVIEEALNAQAENTLKLQDAYDKKFEKFDYSISGMPISPAAKKKSRAKITKVDLQARVKELEIRNLSLEGTIDRLNSTITSSIKKDRDTVEKVEDFRKIIAMWKSAYLETKQKLSITETKMHALRELIHTGMDESQLVGKTVEEKESIISKIMRNACMKLISLEKILKPLIDDYLPQPKFKEWINKQAIKNAIETATADVPSHFDKLCSKLKKEYLEQNLPELAEQNLPELAVRVTEEACRK